MFVIPCCFGLKQKSERKEERRADLEGRVDLGAGTWVVYGRKTPCSRSFKRESRLCKGRCSSRR